MAENALATLLASTSLSAAGPAADPRPEGLAALDRRLGDRAATGVLRVVGGPAALSALCAHIQRRGRMIARRAVVLADVVLDEPPRELAARVGAPVSLDADAQARAVAARVRGAVVALPESRTHWGRAVIDELGRLAEDAAQGTLLVLLGGPEQVAEDPATYQVDVASADDMRVFWEAIGGDALAQVGGGAGIDAVEAFWGRSLRNVSVSRTTELTEAERALMVRLGLARRALTIGQLHALGAPEALQGLIALGLVKAEGEAFLLRSELPEGGVPKESLADAQAVAELLAQEPDVWAKARAAELFALSGAADEAAERHMLGAIGSITDAGTRGDFWARWEQIEATLDVANAPLRRLHSAEIALKLGDFDRALSFGRGAVEEGGETYAALLVIGRASAARGDLTQAELCLGRASLCSPSAEDRARAAVELADLCCSAGRFAEARAHANEAMASASDAETRLLARNVLGKLLLASASWTEAERHFAEDAWEATRARSAVGELRARLNRAIALLSAGRRDEASTMLESVLSDGERMGEERAVAFALANLATIATVRHDYVEALRLFTRSIDALRRLGDRQRLAYIIANLAQLRVKLGLVAEAEQALSFGRKACGPGMSPERAGHFALVSALVHLEKGRTLDASSAIATTIALATSASHGGRLADAYRVEARIALEDGDTTRATEALSRAEAVSTAADGPAETKLLHALLARAKGERFDQLAREAFGLGRFAEDEDIVRQAHVLMHLAEDERGDAEKAAFHLDAAAAVRDEMAAALPDELRAKFLSRRDLVELARIEARFRARELRDDTAALATATKHRNEPETEARTMVGNAPAIRHLRAAIAKVGRADATVLVLGESGTGKELVAEGIHAASSRAAAPLVKVNCAALVETLLLSELFGHEKGSFTGASARRRGRFELADGGTLFLDEIGDISPKTQVALLRVLQEKTFERVGGSTPVRVDVRIVCATHRDLASMVAKGEFREDLYYRLQGVVLEVPALRNRLEDLPPIAEALLRRIASERRVAVPTLSPGAASLLASHAWPGNIRELENALRAAALFAEGNVIQAEDLLQNVASLRSLSERLPLEPVGPVTLRAVPAERSSALGTAAAVGSAVGETETSSVPPLTDVAYASIRQGLGLFEMKRQLEEECVTRALAEAGGNITRAAAILGMKRPRLSQLVKQYGLGSWSEESSS